MHVSRQKYAHELLEQANMKNAKSIAKLMASVPILSSLTRTKLADGTLYRQVVEGLQYLCLTRPDISFAVNTFNQYMHSPHNEH